MDAGPIDRRADSPEPRPPRAANTTRTPRTGGGAGVGPVAADADRRRACHSRGRRDDAAKPRISAFGPGRGYFPTDPVPAGATKQCWCVALLLPRPDRPRDPGTPPPGTWRLPTGATSAPPGTPPAEPSAMAARMGVEDATYLCWERGEHAPDLGALARVLAALGTRLAALESATLAERLLAWRRRNLSTGLRHIGLRLRCEEPERWPRQSRRRLRSAPCRFRRVASSTARASAPPC